MDGDTVFSFNDWLSDKIEGHFHGVPYIAQLFTLYQFGRIPEKDYTTIKDYQEWAYDRAIQLKLAVEKEHFINNLNRAPQSERAGLISDEKTKITERLNRDTNAKQQARMGERLSGQISGGTYQLIAERWERYQHGDWDYSIDTTLTVHDTERGKRLNKGFDAAFKLNYLRWLGGMNEVGLPQDTERMDKVILPDYQQQFKEIEGALLQHGWIDLKRKWQGKIKDLIKLLTILSKDGYFHPKLEGKPKNHQGKLQRKWIAQRYIGEASALDEMAKRKENKPTYETAKGTFRQIDIPQVSE